MTDAFLLDAYAGTHQGKDTLFALGRLASGETYGLIDNRIEPRLFVRVSDQKRVADRLSAKGVGTIVPTSFKTMDGEPVLAVILPSLGAVKAFDRELRDLPAGQRVRTYEGDHDLPTRFLVDHGVRGTFKIEGEWRASEQVARVYVNPTVTATAADPRLVVMALDIETDVSLDRIIAISLVTWEVHGDPSASTEEVYIVGGTHADERALLATFYQRVRELDPDILTGWNVIDFDLPVIIKRAAAAGLSDRLGRAKERDRHYEGQAWGQSRMIVRGRQVLDAMRLVRATPQRFDDHRLGTVAQAILGRGKTIIAEEWEDTPDKLAAAYAKDPEGFAAYCLEDSRLVRDILSALKLLELTVARTRLIGLPLERAWSSVAAFDLIYTAELRRRGIVAPSRGVDQSMKGDSPGGLVLSPSPGLYRDILVFDYKSLYPSIMRTFNIDPLALVTAPSKGAIVAPNGATFARDRGILPALLDDFTLHREAAKKRGEGVAAYVYKIIMNSFYGVLGSSACRFAADDLAGAITGFGHEILRWTRDEFERRGFRVLYGDTDSLFVDPQGQEADGLALAESVNATLARHIEKTWKVASRLDLEFEKRYRRFLLPGSRTGDARAKSYAGLVGDELEITGMEAVRSDWTDLARNLQRELLTRMFHDHPVSSLEEHAALITKAVRRGERDAELIYRKSLRRDLAAYTASSPPHVRAARLLPKRVRVVRYVMTLDGPQPIGFVTAPLDYQHYLDKQVRPIVDGLARFAGMRTAPAAPPEARSLFGD